MVRCQVANVSVVNVRLLGANVRLLFLVPPVRFTSRPDQMEVVICSAQSSAELTTEVSDYDVKVCVGLHYSNS